jgi:hypothetical protein
MPHDETPNAVQDDAAEALKRWKGFIQRAIDMGCYDKETGAPLPDVYQLLTQALAATTCDQFTELCTQAEIALNNAGDIEVVDGFEMNDAVRFTDLALACIFGPDEEEAEAGVD